MGGEELNGALSLGNKYDSAFRNFLFNRMETLRNRDDMNFKTDNGS